MRKKTRRLIWGVLLLGARAFSIDSVAPVAEIDSFFVRDLSLRKFAELVTRGCGPEWKVMVSEQAAKMNVSFYLADTGVDEMLKALCSSYGLWYRKSTNSSIVQIMTKQEYQQGLNLYTDEGVVVLPIMYSQPAQIGESLACIFPDRVVWNPPEDDADDQIDSIGNALDRMDTLADRATLVGAAETDSSTFSDRFSDTTSLNRRTSLDHSGAETGSLDEVYERQSQESIIQQAVQKTRPGLVYVSSFPAANRLIFRSTDAESLARVKQVASELDHAPAQVLLEVKILEVLLDESDTQGVDWMSESSALSAIVYNDYLTEYISAKIQFLAEKDRINNIAAPSLLVSDNEASRIFIGSETTILLNVEPQVEYYGEDNDNSRTTYAVETSREEIGTTLLITPQIHADRSVTIRLLQEESERGAAQRIQYGDQDTDGFTAQDIDSRSVVTTILAQDEQIAAIGGLIREEDELTEVGFPYLKNLPLVGRFFKTVTVSKVRSELIILICPHVILAPGESASVSEKFLNNLHEHGALESLLHPAGAADVSR